MKLKNLKDICKVQLGQPKSNAILKEFEEELKAEAIKWVKFFRRNKIMNGDVVFMDFFNITEEDLKS